MTGPFTCRLANRSMIRLGGEDRRPFLQGLVSNDMDLCAPGKAIHAGLLTPQGKFLHDLFIVDAGEELLIDCEAARAADLLRRLIAHRLRAKVTLQNAAQEYEVWAIFGTGAAGAANGLSYIDPRLPALGMRAILGKGAAGGGAGTDFAAYDRHRLALGVADGSRDLLVEKSTLPEGNFDLLNGISWTKGCYMGQELTARMHYRGLVKKRLFPVKIEGEAPAAGMIVAWNGSEAGEMRSASGNLGLALLNVEKTQAAIREGAAFTCGASRLKPSRPEWMNLDEK